MNSPRPGSKAHRTLDQEIKEKHLNEKEKSVVAAEVKEERKLQYDVSSILSRSIEILHAWENLNEIIEAPSPVESAFQEWISEVKRFVKSQDVVEESVLIKDLRGSLLKFIEFIDFNERKALRSAIVSGPEEDIESIKQIINSTEEMEKIIHGSDIKVSVDDHDYIDLESLKDSRLLFDDICSDFKKIKEYLSEGTQTLIDASEFKDKIDFTIGFIVNFEHRKDADHNENNFLIYGLWKHFNDIQENHLKFIDHYNIPKNGIMFLNRWSSLTEKLTKYLFSQPDTIKFIVNDYDYRIDGVIEDKVLKVINDYKSKITEIESRLNNEKITEYSIEAKAVIETIKKDKLKIDDLTEKVEKKSEESIKSMNSSVGADTQAKVAKEYIKNAEEEGQNFIRYRYASIACMVISILLMVVTVFIPPTKKVNTDDPVFSSALSKIDQLDLTLPSAESTLAVVKAEIVNAQHVVDPWQAGLRILLSLLLTVPAAYLAKEAAKHRIQQNAYLQIAMNVSAVKSLIGDLDKEVQDSIFADLANKLFASPVGVGSNVAADAYPMNINDMLLKMLDKMDFKTESVRPTKSD